MVWAAYLQVPQVDLVELVHGDDDVLLLDVALVVVVLDRLRLAVLAQAMPDGRK